jgi:hypothetical protein
MHNSKLIRDKCKKIVAREERNNERIHEDLIIYTVQKMYLLDT